MLEGTLWKQLQSSSDTRVIFASCVRLCVITLCLEIEMKFWGTWVAQLVKCLTLAQVMISRLVSSSPTSGSVLTAQSLEPDFSFCLSLSLCLSICSSPTHALSLPLKNKWTLKNVKEKKSAVRHWVKGRSLGLNEKVLRKSAKHLKLLFAIIIYQSTFLYEMVFLNVGISDTDLSKSCARYCDGCFLRCCLI